MSLVMIMFISFASHFLGILSIKYWLALCFNCNKFSPHKMKSWRLKFGTIFALLFTGGLIAKLSTHKYKKSHNNLCYCSECYVKAGNERNIRLTIPSIRAKGCPQTIYF